jgi:hypothetical protein
VLAGAALAAAVLGLGVSALAHRLATSTGTFRYVWLSSHLAIFGWPEIGALFSCPLTLEGTFHSRTVSKVSGQLIGYVTSAFVGRAEACSGGSLTILHETLPWHVRYDSFTGTLPSISSVKSQIIGVKMRLADASITCTFTSTASGPLFATASRERGGLVAQETLSGTIPADGFCAFGASSITLAGATPGVTSQEGAAMAMTLVM